MSRLVKVVFCWLAFIALAGCSAMSALTEETFTFQGDLPKNFGLRAQAHYYSVDKGCSVSRRALLREFETEPMFENKERHYQFEIPVSYRTGTCAVKLRRVGLYIYGRYGEQDWQKTYELGGLYAVDQLPEGSPSFDGAGVMRKQAQCEWLFQISKLYLELSKLLTRISHEAGRRGR